VHATVTLIVYELNKPQQTSHRQYKYCKRKKKIGGVITNDGQSYYNYCTDKYNTFKRLVMYVYNELDIFAQTLGQRQTFRTVGACVRQVLDAIKLASLHYHERVFEGYEWIDDSSLA